MGTVRRAEDQREDGSEKILSCRYKMKCVKSLEREQGMNYSFYLHITEASAVVSIN